MRLARPASVRPLAPSRSSRRRVALHARTVSRRRMRRVRDHDTRAGRPARNELSDKLDTSYPTRESTVTFSAQGPSEFNKISAHGRNLLRKTAAA